MERREREEHIGDTSACLITLRERKGTLIQSHPKSVILVLALYPFSWRPLSLVLSSAFPLWFGKANIRPIALRTTCVLVIKCTKFPR